MAYDYESREIIFKFTSIGDLSKVNGLHPIKLELIDKSGLS